MPQRSLFTQRVVRIIQQIPRGKVAAYGQVAALAGNPQGARQVVRILNVLWEKEKLPWHRIINKQGRIALPRGQGFELQRTLLQKEGVTVDREGNIDLGKYRWTPQPKRGRT